jgi:hypothetical protein
MLIRGAQLWHVAGAAQETGVRLLDPRVEGVRTTRIQTRLALSTVDASGEKKRGRLPYVYQRTSARHDGRRVAAVCWHGHRDFLRALFRLCPDAVVRTAIAVYRGAEGFEETFPATAHRNIGSAYMPCTMAEACLCDE